MKREKSVFAQKIELSAKWMRWMVQISADLYVNVTGWEHWFFFCRKQRNCADDSIRWNGLASRQPSRRVPENGVNESNQVPVTQTKREKKAEKRWQKIDIVQSETLGRYLTAANKLKLFFFIFLCSTSVFHCSAIVLPDDCSPPITIRTGKSAK